MKTKLIITTIFPLLIASAAMAQNAVTIPPAQPLPAAASPVVSPTAAVPVQPPAAVAVQPAAAVPVQPVTAVPVQPAAPAEAADAVPPTPKNEIRMNFQNASLTDVLNYLSSAAGFIIVQQTPVSGTVNVISKTPVTADEAVALLEKVLATKGYTVLRDGRILNIVPRAGAEKNPNVRVVVNKNDVPIPKDEEVVTEIIPIRYLDATKIIENLRPLLSTEAIISVNESSNAILITDTQANIHRIAEIIKALDTSISSISTIKVYALRYADAKEFSGVLMQLFAPDQSGANGQGGGGGLRAFFGGGRGGGGGGFGGGGGGGEDTGAASGAQSEARKAASRVVAVPDTQSNSVVVSAPDEYIQQIDQIVTDLDTSTTDITETKIFQLKNADSSAVSVILNSLYGDSTTTSGSNNNRNGQGGGRGGAGGGGGGRGGQPATAAAQPSERSLLQARMVAVPDPRTNSILVNCSPDTMLQVAQTIGTLDATNAKKQVVKVIALQHADPDSVVGILRTLFNDPTASTTTTSALTTRQLIGASSDVTNTLSTSGNGATGR